MQFTLTTTVFASVALLFTLSAAAPVVGLTGFDFDESLDRRAVPAGEVRVQLDGNDPPGEDAIQKNIKTDDSVNLLAGDRVLIGASVIDGVGNCRLYSDFGGVVSINKPFSNGKEVDISPPTLARSIRCTPSAPAGAAQANTSPKAPEPKAPAAKVTSIVRVQFNGNNPAGEDAIQSEIVLDGSAQPTRKDVIVGAFIVSGKGNCKLYSDPAGNVSINQPFSSGKEVTFPPTLVKSIRCTV